MNFQEKPPIPEETSQLEQTNKREHLKEEFRPIMACVGNIIDFLSQWQDPESRPELFFDHTLFNPPDMPGAWNVDYYGEPEKLKENGFKNRGKHSYVISPVDSLDKFSAKLINCTSVLVTGKDKDSGENISFMSHQSPKYFLDDTKKDLFSDDLKERLKELKERSVDGLVDAVILGGNHIKDEGKKNTEAYIKSIESLNKEISDILGFEPMVIAGPKTSRGSDEVFYENKSRRMYIARPFINKSQTGSFAPSEIKKERENWE